MVAMSVTSRSASERAQDRANSRALPEANVIELWGNLRRDGLDLRYLLRLPMTNEHAVGADGPRR